MDVEWLQIFFGSIYIISIFLIGWILWRKGILRFRIGAYLGYFQFHTNRICRAKYKFFNGSKPFYFRFPKEATIRLKYAVKVEKGEITIHLRNKEGEIFSRTFSDDEEGEYEFMAKRKWNSVHFDGHKTKGSFSAEFLVIKK